MSRVLNQLQHTTMLPKFLLKKQPQLIANMSLLQSRINYILPRHPPSFLGKHIFHFLNSKLTSSRDIVMYRTDDISLVLGTPYQLNKPHQPLFWVSITMDNRLPPIRLHSGPDDTYPLLGSVKFNVGPVSDISFWRSRSGGNGVVNNTEAGAEEAQVEIKPKGFLTSDNHTFRASFSSSGPGGEVFEWKHSGSTEVKALATDNVGKEDYAQQTRGLKLVRVADNKEVAIFVGGVHGRTLNPKRIAGKLRFVGDEQGSEEWKLCAVLSILTIFERGYVFPFLVFNLMFSVGI